MENQRFTNDQIRDVLGPEALTRLAAVTIGQRILAEVPTMRSPADAVTVTQAYNVVRHGSERDIHLGAELVGHIVLRDQEDYRDNPESAVLEARDLLQAFKIDSRMPLTRALEAQSEEASHLNDALVSSTR